MKKARLRLAIERAKFFATFSAWQHLRNCEYLSDNFGDVPKFSDSF